MAEKWQEILSVTMKDLSEIESANINCGTFCCGCGLGKSSLDDKWISTILAGDYFICEQCYQRENYQASVNQYIGANCILNRDCKNNLGESRWSPDNRQGAGDLLVKVGWYVAQNSYLTFHCCNNHTEKERDKFLEIYQRACIENIPGGTDELQWVRFHDFKSHLYKLPANVPLMMTNHPSL